MFVEALFGRVTAQPAVSLASRNVRFSEQVKCPVWSSNKNHSVVAVEAVGKCESRVVCGICKLGGKVCFWTFPLNVFSTALICFLVRGINSFPSALYCPTRCPAIIRVKAVGEILIWDADEFLDKSES